MRPACGACRHFEDRPGVLEQELVGLTILSSAWGDCRGDQGVCRVHGEWLVPRMWCERFAARAEPRAAAAAPGPGSSRVRAPR